MEQSFLLLDYNMTKLTKPSLSGIIIRYAGFKNFVLKTLYNLLSPLPQPLYLPTMLTFTYSCSCSQLQDGVFEMTCTLHIEANLLKYSRGYKYVVYSPKMVEKDDCFEYLHAFVGRTSNFQDPNRHLIVKSTEVNGKFTCMFSGIQIIFIYIYISGNEYLKYDYFVYPKATKVEKGHLSQAATAVRRFFTGQDDDRVERFTPLATDEMMKQCLLFYLEPFKDLLLHKVAYPDNFRIDHFVEQVRTIMQQHKVTLVRHPAADTPNSTNSTNYTVKVTQIEQVSNTCYMIYACIYYYSFSNRTSRNGWRSW